ncbi:MAG: YciI family protein [Candidatus Odinarchaeota archaeon]
MPDNLEFLYLLKPAKRAASLEEYMKALTPEEKEVLQQHFKYMDELQKARKVILGGPCLDAAYIILILRVESKEEAEKIIANEPAVKANILAVESQHPFQTEVIAMEFHN